MKKEVILIGYSGHAYVACDIFISMGWKILGYCEKQEKKQNPYQLKYFGSERDEKNISLLKKNFCFVAIGDSDARKKVFEFLTKNEITVATAIHSSAVVSPKAQIGSGVMIAPLVTINSNAVIHDGAICNSSSVIEHDCEVGRFAHIAPNATLCGNVRLGEGTLIGANAVVKPSIAIGKNSIVGLGSVVLKNISDNKKVAGVPAREI